MRFQQRCEPFPFIKGKPCCITGDVVRLSIVVLGVSQATYFTMIKE